MAHLKGITVTLYEKTKTGIDPFGNAIYEESPVEVDNVLVTPTSSQDVIDTLSIENRKAVYTLAIPKGDNHTWENTTVEFFGEKWLTIGIATGGIEDLIPLEWNKKISVERYE